MLNHEYLFTPIGDPPTINNITVGFIIISAMFIIGYVILYFGSKPVNRIFNLIIYGIFITAGLYSLSQTKYLKVIKIDPVNKKLSYNYLTMTGKKGVVTINILAAKYSFEFHRSRLYTGYILTLKDKDSELQIKETRKPGKRSKNVLLFREMNRMDSVIMQIRNKSRL